MGGSWVVNGKRSGKVRKSLIFEERHLPLPTDHGIYGTDLLYYGENASDGFGHYAQGAIEKERWHWDPRGQKGKENF
jgi:hypothetical protein